LDRAFTVGENDRFIVAEEAKQKAANRKIKNEVFKSEEKKKTTNNEKAMRRNCFDDRNTQDNGEYDYLANYKQIIGEKLNILNKQFFVPTFFEGKTISDKDFFINMARLGHTLHGVEDFFAHSNFIELLVECMDDIKKQHPDMYYTHDEFMKRLKEDDNGLIKNVIYEIDRYKKTLFKPIRDFNLYNYIEQKDYNLSTGIFAEGDANTSIYHNVFGHLHEELDNLDFHINNEVTDVIVYIIDYFKDYIAKMETLPRDMQIVLGNENPISVKILKFILNENSDTSTIKNKKIWDLIDEQQLAYYAELCNNILRLHKTIQVAKLVPKTALNLLLVSLSIIFAPLYIEYMLKEILKEFALAKVLKFLVKEPIKYGLNILGDHIESQHLNLKDKIMWGTHSIMAKDEAYRNENWNYQAKRMAIFMDKLVLSHMLWGTSRQSEEAAIEVCDLTKLLQVYLLNPQKYASKNNIAKPEVANNVSIVNIIDLSTNLPVNKTIEEFYKYGFILRNKSFSDTLYKDAFWEANLMYLYKFGDTLEQVLKLDMKTIKQHFPNFDKLNIPMQTQAKTIYYHNNAAHIPQTVEIDPITITTESSPKYRYWMLQFFNKKYYTKFENDNTILDRALNWLNANPDTNEPYKIADTINLFADDPDIIIEMETAQRMNINDIRSDCTLEIKHKKDMELFMERFIKIAYD
jgi:hypothetical protein